MTPINQRKHGNFFSFHYFNSMFLAEDICVVLIMLATSDKYLYLCLSIMFIKIIWALYSLYKVNQVLSKPSSSSKTQVAEVGLEWTGEWSFTYLLQTLGLLTVFRVVVGITWNWILPIEFLFQLYEYYFCVEHVHLPLRVLGWRFYHLPKAKKARCLISKKIFFPHREIAISTISSTFAVENLRKERNQKNEEN